MHALRYSYTFPTGYVQKYPAMDAYGMTLPILWGYCASATTPTQAEVDGFTVIQSSLNPLSGNVTAAFLSSGHTTKHLIVMVPTGLTAPSALTATALTMTAQADPALFNANQAQLSYKVYISTALISGNGTITISP